MKKQKPTNKNQEQTKNQPNKTHKKHPNKQKPPKQQQQNQQWQQQLKKIIQNTKRNKNGSCFILSPNISIPTCLPFVLQNLFLLADVIFYTAMKFFSNTYFSRLYYGQILAILITICT